MVVVVVIVVTLILELLLMVEVMAEVVVVANFANFQCHVCLKFGHTSNDCHFRSNISYQPCESLYFTNPATLVYSLFWSLI